MQKKDYRNKKGRNFHKLLPNHNLVVRNPPNPHNCKLKKLFLILDLLYVSIDHGHGCDVYDILYTAL